jgi:hypothetical protein
VRRRSSGRLIQEGGDQSPILDIIPGKELERAAATVVTDAGKSLIAGLRRTLGAWTAEWVARREARADAARMAIQTQAQIDSRQALANAERQLEFQEIEHSGRQGLAVRRLDRLLKEITREQENLEAVILDAVERIEKLDAQASRPDDDWLLRFSEYAQKVSDTEIRKLWSQALASATTQDFCRLSPSALSLLSIMDRRAAQDFQVFCQLHDQFGDLPSRYAVRQPFHSEVDAEAGERRHHFIPYIKELGLVQESTEHHILGLYLFARWEQPVLLIRPSERGREIMRACVDANPLTDQVKTDYLEQLFLFLPAKATVTIHASDNEYLLILGSLHNLPISWSKTQFKRFCFEQPLAEALAAVVTMRRISLQRLKNHKPSGPKWRFPDSAHSRPIPNSAPVDRGN